LLPAGQRRHSIDIDPRFLAGATSKNKKKKKATATPDAMNGSVSAPNGTNDQQHDAAVEEDHEEEDTDAVRYKPAKLTLVV